MPIDALAGTDNVIQFPIEFRQRPSMELLRELLPDARVVLVQAEAFGFERPPHDLREQTDLATAEHIAEYAGADERASERFLDDLLQPVVARAVGLARLAGEAASVARAAQQAAEAPRASANLKDHVNEITVHCVHLQLEAYAVSEEAEGVARAVQYARRGEPWVPRGGWPNSDIAISGSPA